MKIPPNFFKKETFEHISDMKRISIITIIIITTISLMSCNNKNVKEWSDQEIETWFSESNWSKELPMKPDLSINKRLFAEQNILNPTVWKAAYRFLEETDFNTIAEGKYELDSLGTYASVTDYTTKDPDTTYYESHRKYIDIQYVSKGQEYIGITSLDDIRTVIKEYNEEKDIEFFDKDNGTLLLANKGKFFVFFPSDGHKPCLKVDTNAMARKIVVKVPVALN